MTGARIVHKIESRNSLHPAIADTAKQKKRVAAYARL